jgi:hypothetical protein
LPITTLVTLRLRVGVVLVGLLIGAIGLWLASTLGASFGVRVLVLMASSYTGTWVAILVGQLLLGVRDMRAPRAIKGTPLSCKAVVSAVVGP